MIPDFSKVPFANLFEDFLRKCVEGGAERIGLCAVFPDGDCVTGYFNASPGDKALFAHHFQSDAMFDQIAANADWLAERIAEAEDWDEDDDDWDDE